MSANSPNEPGPRREPTQRPAWLSPTPPRQDELGNGAAVGERSLRELTLRLMRGENLQREEASVTAYSFAQARGDGRANRRCTDGSRYERRNRRGAGGNG